MKVLVYRTIVGSVDLPDGMFTYDENGSLPANEVFDFMLENDVDVEETEEVEEEREVIFSDPAFFHNAK